MDDMDKRVKRVINPKVERLIRQKAEITKRQDEISRKLKIDKRNEAIKERKQRTRCLIEISSWIFSRENQEKYGADYEKVYELLKESPGKASLEIERIAVEIARRSRAVRQ